tara:strand:+ start:13769 stop:14434 length:666 start_codon:yes stop_codon:yes gene_type:complete
MSEQLFFNFPFKKNYLSQDFYVSENNYNAFKLIESWPNWTSRFVNIFGPKGCGKTHLINVLGNKMKGIIIKSSEIDEKILNSYKLKECLIIDNFENNIDERLFYSIINMAVQDNKFLIVSSIKSIKKFQIKLKDLSSRFTSFIDIGIDLPADDLLRVILAKNFSDKQVEISTKNIEYILKNIDRSYEKVNLFTSTLDSLSLTKGQPINLKLIKNVLEEIKN